VVAVRYTILRPEAPVYLIGPRVLASTSSWRRDLDCAAIMFFHVTTLLVACSYTQQSLFTATKTRQYGLKVTTPRHILASCGLWFR
jgi:hypothetical protein